MADRSRKCNTARFLDAAARRSYRSSFSSSESVRTTASAVRSGSAEGMLASTSGGFKKRPVASKIGPKLVIARAVNSGGSSALSSEPNVQTRSISAALMRRILASRNSAWARSRATSGGRASASSPAISARRLRILLRLRPNGGCGSTQTMVDRRCAAHGRFQPPIEGRYFSAHCDGSRQFCARDAISAPMKADGAQSRSLRLR